jgi:hypothetical protein
MAPLRRTTMICRTFLSKMTDKMNEMLVPLTVTAGTMGNIAFGGDLYAVASLFGISGYAWYKYYINLPSLETDITLPRAPKDILRERHIRHRWHPRLRAALLKDDVTVAPAPRRKPEVEKVSGAPRRKPEVEKVSGAPEMNMEKEAARDSLPRAQDATFARFKEAASGTFINPKP